MRTKRITVCKATHPVPDAVSQAAAQEVPAAARSRADDLVLALISGGGSVLMAAPVPSLTLQDKIQTNRIFLRSGLAIPDMNRIRCRLSPVEVRGRTCTLGDACDLGCAGG
ncbi:MAG: DUF4147 domain-containing protein [Alphaproteobacteria bacterium]|nr:DUF4147 domain-containing protein [Alphaproteobacteria bacterium]